MCHLGQITVTPNSHMLEPLSYSYGLLSDFLICPLDRIYLFYLNHTQWYSREHKKYNGLEGKQ